MNGYKSTIGATILIASLMAGAPVVAQGTGGSGTGAGGGGDAPVSQSGFGGATGSAGTGPVTGDDRAEPRSPSATTSSTGTATTGSATTDTQVLATIEVPPSATASDISAQLQAAGFSEVKNESLSGAIYKAEAMYRGDEVHVRVDTRTGAVEQVASATDGLTTDSPTMTGTATGTDATTRSSDAMTPGAAPGVEPTQTGVGATTGNREEGPVTGDGRTSN